MLLEGIVKNKSHNNVTLRDIKKVGHYNVTIRNIYKKGSLKDISK